MQVTIMKDIMFIERKNLEIKLKKYLLIKSKRNDGDYMNESERKNQKTLVCGRYNR